MEPLKAGLRPRTPKLAYGQKETQIQAGLWTINPMELHSKVLEKKSSAVSIFLFSLFYCF